MQRKEKNEVQNSITVWLELLNSYICTSERRKNSASDMFRNPHLLRLKSQNYIKKGYRSINRTGSDLDTPQFLKRSFKDTVLGVKNDRYGTKNRNLVPSEEKKE